MEGKNNLKSELHHVLHPKRSRRFWIVFYLILICVVGFAFYRAADRIQLHSLPTGSVQLNIPYAKYLVGEAISFSIENRFNSAIYVTNDCPNEPLAVYRKEGERWVRLHDKTSIDECPNQERQVIIPANSTVNGSFAPWKNLFNKPGTYRIVAHVEYYNALPYQELEVIEPPKVESKPQAVGGTSSSNQTTTTQAPYSNTSAAPSGTTSSNQLATTPARQERTVSTSGGTITVQYEGTMIYVISIVDAQGCSHEGGRSGTQVEVTFKCGGSETQVQLQVINGQLAQKIETD